MLKEMNRKAEGTSISTIIGLIIAVVMLVLIILFATGRFDSLNDVIDVVGGSGATISDVVTRCKTDINTGNKYSYCNEFDELKIDGKIEYVSCADPRVESAIDNLGKPNCKEEDVFTKLGDLIGEKEKLIVKVNNQEYNLTKNGTDIYQWDSEGKPNIIKTP